MSTHFNSMFCTYTQGFIQQNFMTAFRIGVGGVPAGGALFDLHHHMVNRHQFVTLEIWTMMPLNSDEIPLISYWVPQGGSCLVPARPARTYVFTPDFSGCSILVDQIDPNWYKVYHVQGGVSPQGNVVDV